MYEKNNPKEKIIEKAKIKSRIHPLHRFLFFISFIILSFLFNIEAIALVNENFKYKTFYLKMISFFILCLFPITEYDKMKSIMIFLPSLVLLFFHVTFIPLSPMFLSFLCFFTKIYSLAYLRIWIDQFAMIKFKTLFIYILNIFALSGDKISMVINKYINYKKILTNILIIQFVIFVVFFMIPDKFFFIHNKLVHYRTKIAELKEKENEESIIEKKEEDEIDNDEEKNEEIEENDENESVSVFINYEQEKKPQRKTKNTKFKNPEEEVKIFNNYENIISLLSISGSIFGGILSIFIGGYESISSCIVVSLSDIIIIITCYYLSYSHFFMIIFISFCFCFFFVNVIMGSIEGFIIKSIPLKYKELGINFSGLLSNISCFLARNIYDYIKITFDKSFEFFAWRFCMCCFLFGFFSILLACTYRYRDIGKTKKTKKEQKDQEGTEMTEEEYEEELSSSMFKKRSYQENMNKSELEEDRKRFDDLLDYGSGSLDTMLRHGKAYSSKAFDSATS